MQFFQKFTSKVKLEITFCGQLEGSKLEKVEKAEKS